MGIAEVAAGGVVGTYLVNGPLKTTTSANMLMMGAGIALALVAPKMWPLGAGIASAGAISAAQNANFISGTHGAGPDGCQRRTSRQQAHCPGGGRSSAYDGGDKSRSTKCDEYSASGGGSKSGYHRRTTESSDFIRGWRL